MMGKIGYKLAPELADKKPNPEYNVTVANNIITIPAHIAMADKYGTVTMIIEIPDTTDNMAYTYSCNYIVDKNLAYTANLHTSIDNVVKLTDQQFYDKGIRSGLADAQTTAKKSDIANFLNKNLDDVNLSKLNEKIQLTDSGKEAKQNTADLLKKANIDMTNIAPATFNRELTQNKAFQDLQNKHPSTTGKTDKEIKDLFYANRYEVQDAIDLTQLPYADVTTIILAFQITREGQAIKQTLQPHDKNQIVMVELLFSTGIKTGSVEIDVASGEHLDGSHTDTNRVVINEEGYAGYFMPLRNEAGYEFISHYETNTYSLGISDNEGNIALGVTDIEFDDGFIVEGNGSTGKVKLKPVSTPGSSITFKDGDSDFKADTIHSLDKSIRISDLGGVADFSVIAHASNEGIMATLGRDETLNTEYPKSRLYFSDFKHKGGSFVYPDIQKKSFVVQDIVPDDDPNVSGGTTFLVGLYLEPSSQQKSVITQKGYIKLELVDDNDNVMMDINGNPIAVQIDYNGGEEEKKEIYFGELQAKGLTYVHLNVESNFPTEEILSIGANTAICLQAITKDCTSGLALMNFMLHTGYRVQMDSIYYGTNSMNFAQFLLKDQTNKINQPFEFSFGDNTFLDVQNSLLFNINNYVAEFKDNGVDLPIFSIYKRYNKYDTFVIGGKQAKATIKTINRINALNVMLLAYRGNEEPKAPCLLSITNGTHNFNDGWTIEDKLFIMEEPDGIEHTHEKTFDLPSDAKELAIVVCTNDTQTTDLFISDIQVDIIPSVTRIKITDSSHIAESYLIEKKRHYKSQVACPIADYNYRYTSDVIDTKMPIGVIGGGSDIVNNNAWFDVGSTDPNKTQGDFQFLKSGRVTMSYDCLVFNEKDTVNDVEFWLAKVEDGGVFTEVPNSRVATTIEANRTKIAKKVSNTGFTFNVKENESYRFFAKSNMLDGFYLMCMQTTPPLIKFMMEFDEQIEYNKDIIEANNEVKFIENGQEVFNKILEYDVTTGKFTVKEKVGV